MGAPRSSSPAPLGVTPVPGGANVAVYSAHATAIEFCLFDAGGDSQIASHALAERTGHVFHGFVPGVAAGSRYGLRAHGPWSPREGHRFNPAKLLVDPYATILDRRYALHPAMFGTTPDGARDDQDSAPFMPKAVVAAASPPRAASVKRRPPETAIVYELHVGGFTRSHPGVPEAIRGTCAGLAHPAAFSHLMRLGVTTVELMPVAAWIDERHLVSLGLGNYWGYNPVSLMVPDPRLCPAGMAELADCVAALHEAGLEVILDVVLNHTGEGDEHGPTLSLRGLDNATYYRTMPGDGARYVDDAGCGNTLALDRPPVMALALDALRHYVRAAGVDGFRFDLATTLARRDAGFDPEAPFLAAVAADPMLRDLRLIAEPWDIGPGGHRLGAFPAAWGEWNDRYRDAVRRFWRGDESTVAELATRLAGSSDIFAGRAPSRSVNFVCAHDGFTLADLVSHERKRNDANGEGNRDGTDANHSWNNGAEGASTDPAIVEARRRDARNLLATLLVSRGTPMLSMGDELGRTQLGNNNAYAHDDPLSWVDWTGADRALGDAAAALIALRRNHPALRADRWLTGAAVDGTGIPDVEWRCADGRALSPADWNRGDLHALVVSLYEPGAQGVPADRVAIALNAGREALAVRWPAPRAGQRWRRAADTSNDGAVPDPGVVDADAGDRVAPRSVAILVEEIQPP